MAGATTRASVGGADLHLLQALRHRDRSHGRELSQRRPDRGARRLRSADDQPRVAGPTAGATAALPRALDPPAAKAAGHAATYNEPTLPLRSTKTRWHSEKLAEGIRAFVGDTDKAGQDHRGSCHEHPLRLHPPQPGPHCKGHYEAHGRGFDLREAFARDGGRARGVVLRGARGFCRPVEKPPGYRDPQSLLDLARECGLEARRDAMFAGAPINATEDRAVLHTALRAPRGAGPVQRRGARLCSTRCWPMWKRVRNTNASGIRHVVNIGIGGSDLGPQMVVPALDAYGAPGGPCCTSSAMSMATTSTRVLRRLNAKETLFIIASKTFTTQETMANAMAARAWFLAQGMAEADIAKHFVATTTNVKAAAQFGIHTTFGFWDWVSRRCSLWSAIGLPIAIAISAAPLRSLLEDAPAMDRHFANAPLTCNLPVQLQLLRPLVPQLPSLHQGQRLAPPSHQGLARLPAYLQQLVLESNGKRVTAKDGSALAVGPTSPALWGEAGTNGQHAFFQWLHQGTREAPVEFIVPISARRTPPGGSADRCSSRTALAQAQALMLGKSADEAMKDSAPTASATFDRAQLAQHRSFPGNRPSTTLVLDALTPRSLGALTALYEHRVFTSGALWGINSFDQWGVELGKALTNQLLPRFASRDVQGLDGFDRGAAEALDVVTRAHRRLRRRRRDRALAAATS